MKSRKVTKKRAQAPKVLAWLGGSPAFAEALHVGRPNLGDRAALVRRVEEMLDRKWLTNNGPFVQELEGRIAKLVGVKHCVAMCNATVALEIVIRALELKGEVIVPSYTFVATAHALQWQEITPVFCDLDPATHNLDPAQVRRMITPRTTGIIGVHLWGRPCAVDELTAIARERKLVLMFDAAHAFGCTHKGRMIGRFGEAEVFSFHATKVFNSSEGGAVVTNNDELAAKMRLMRNFGFAGYDDVVYIGTNGKMTELSAAMGLTNLEKLEDFLAANRRNYTIYRQELDKIPGIKIVRFNEREKCNYHYVVAEVDESKLGLSRDELISVFHAENILARKYFWPGAHRMEPYRSYFPHASLLLPNTETVAARVIVLPNGISLGELEVRTVCRVLKEAVRQAAEVKRALRHRK